MKNRPSLSPKQLLLAALCLIVFSLLVLFIKNSTDTQADFDRLTRKLTVEQLTQSTIDLHYTLAYPEQQGITDYTPTLPCYNAARDQKDRLYLENVLNSLNKISEEQLREQDTYLLRLLKRSLTNSLDMAAHPYYSEPLSPSGGMHTQLPVLLSNYTFRSLRDVEDYLALLDAMDEYFASLLTFEQEKKEAGLFMATVTVDKVIEQCDTIVTYEELMTGSHFLQTSFQERLEQLAACLTAEENSKEVLDARAIESYVKENNRLLKEVVLPASQTLADGLFLLREENRPLTGLAAYEDGADYYEQLLIAETGSYTAPAQVKQMYIQRLRQEYEEICRLLSEYDELPQALLRQEYTDLPLETPNEILTDLKVRMAEDFPSYLFAENTEPNVKILEVQEPLAAYSAPAFYLTVPFDDSSSNVIYINNSSSFDDLELYTTLAHEAYPGHLYQTVFYNRYFTADEQNLMRQLLWYGGYLEGWSVYVEFIAYDYAADLLREEHRLADALCVEAEKHNRSMQLCLYSLLDYVIHYENLSAAELAPYLEPFGITDPEDMELVYQVIVEEPCNYPKYYLGYLEICKLKELAESSWGKDYTDYRFHSFLLEQGPSDFATLTEALVKEELIPSLGYHTLQIPSVP